MRFILLSLLFSPYAISQSCTETTITDQSQPYTCTTLTIGPGVHDFRVLVPPAPGVVEINVTGDVTIAPGAVLVLSGGDGVPSNNAVTDGGVAGPGGSDGGFASPFPENAPEGVAPDDCGGDQGVSDTAAPVCGSGGGGGGFLTAGTIGLPCLGNLGGAPGNPYINLATFFRGGFGGGSGGSATAGPVFLGTGGGGGGAILINAGGNVTLNGTIDVRGGRGGNAPAGSNAGGGGGGSGGAIRIESAGQIINNANFLLSGGNGGNGDGTGSNGGPGSAGIFEFQDSDNIIYGTGTGAIPLPGESFNSSISCGAVKMKDDQNLLFQMIFGFALVVLISRIRGRYRRSV